MNNRILARRQKDLNGYNDRIQLELEKTLGPHMQDLAPAWQRMTVRLEKKVEALYKQAGAIENPVKIQALQNEAQRLSMLQASLAGDLKRMEANLQPYYTGMLKHQFEKSYYLNAFGLEQAGRVSVQVPLLTQSQVLGVIANPWLKDGANYATRLGRNTAYLAEKMRGVVAEAVSEGWGISKAAQRIREVAGEGLYNATRLARTELNRAANLGASYTAMQNADILDGKRWNATLDARTAPKDADNDGEIYDLDYDTPENEGVPGERIPNHPNCRCKWTPVLSALGVSTRERIARGEGDSTTAYGERTYTKARTYREYAEKRGLPNLDDRLARDNLKGYLRPGETLADLNKNVVRWTPPVGPEIVVPKPVWEQAQAEVKQEAAKQQTVQQIKDRIAQGVNTEADVREVGDLVSQEVEGRVASMEKRADDLDKIRQQLIDEVNAGQYEGKKYDEWKARYDAIGDEYYKLRVAAGGEKADIIRDVLKDIRPMGPEGSVQAWAPRSKIAVKDAVNHVRNYLPTDWVKTSNASEMLTKTVKRGYYREAWRNETAIMALSGQPGPGMLRVAFHEMGHRMEDMIPKIKQLENEFYARRTKGEALKWLGGNYSRSEKTRFDDFLKPYMGKDYGNTTSSFYELFSMGLEGVFANSYDISKDKDYMDFILGILASV